MPNVSLLKMLPNAPPVGGGKSAAGATGTFLSGSMRFEAPNEPWSKESSCESFLIGAPKDERLCEEFIAC